MLPGYTVEALFTLFEVHLVAQLVKNLRAIWETWVRSLVWEDPLEEGMATHSSILAWRILMDRGKSEHRHSRNQRTKMDWNG